MALSATTALAGCRFDGLGAQPLPGSVGTGDGALVFEVALPDVGTLTPNAQVRLDDVAGAYLATTTQ